jgi:hypothetical protein
MRMYHRKDGRIVKERDDVMSASRYALMMIRFAKPEPFDDDADDSVRHSTRSTVTGY